ncbi:MAG: DUF4492 domain-containing protein [Desulforhopalus sp.]
MFAVLKLCFFSNQLYTNFSTDQQGADHVTHQLTDSIQDN